MIALRVAESDSDLEAWRQVRMAVLPNERTLTVEEMRTQQTPEQLLLLAFRDGELAGSGIVNRSDSGAAFTQPRVLPGHRLHGVGTKLLLALAAHATWLTSVEATFVALDADQIVGMAGLLPDPDHPQRAENALTAVRHDHRRRGIARALKQHTIHVASMLGLREIYTWTQTGNEAMQALNRSLGYVDRTVVATLRASLPLKGSR